ncbi:sensor histidine kinase [Sediminitomix flava]|uniref:Histidine kinase n=1 Tax=Sediminitomix flava TaxID=379075 RepID=A0A315ZAX3_SEDFL|nr:sensor histidine kinase [Sediminitomix flava]PWJ42299.1 histidine kinase [Sediminitomix flava]
MIFKSPFLVRLVVVFLLHLIVKGFDETFEIGTELTLRGILYSTYAISYWMVVWYVVEFLNRQFKIKNLTSKAFMNWGMALFFGAIYDRIYYYADTYFYQNHETWSGMEHFNPILTIALSIFYMLVYGISEVIHKDNLLREEQLRVKELEKQNIENQFLALKRQIEPHFLFNSLSVLSGLVYTDQDLASEFIVKLSKILRYIIEQNEKTLVLLEDEIQVVNDYFFLLETRFKKSIELDIQLQQNTLMKFYVSPTAIQGLIENAVKHNRMSETNPLRVVVLENTENIIVRNKLNRKDYQINSTKEGLKNLKQKYHLLAKREVQVIEEENMFTVKIPLLSKQVYERFNH